MAKYFLGREEVAKFDIKLKNEKANLHCIVTEYWSSILNDSAKCGATITHEVSRKIGLKKSEKEDFEKAIEGSIGSKNIAKVKAATKNNISSEFHWEVIKEEKRVFEFPSPKCGNYLALQYQKHREYNYSYQEEGWFHKSSWQFSLTEHTNCFHDDSKIIDPDSSCNCTPKPKIDYDGLVHVDFGDVSMNALYRKTEIGIEVSFLRPEAGIYINAPSISSINEMEINSIPSKGVPESLKFLGDIKGKTHKAVISLYPESASEQEKPHRIEIEDIDLLEISNYEIKGET